MDSNQKMEIEIWSDVMCPFCYIGKRRFEKALRLFEHTNEINIQWKSFQLNPDMVTDPEKNIIEYLAEVKGWSITQSKDMHQHVVNMAKDEGLTYNFDKAVVANSFDAHRLVQMAKEKGLDDQAEELLFKTYFTDGGNIANHSLLIELGKQIGLEENKVGQMLNSQLYTDKVEQDMYEAQVMGIKGVPFFVINKKYGISGAQSSETFLSSITNIYNEWKTENKVELNTENGFSCDVEGNCNPVE